MSLAHSKIGASSMERWANCAGSVKLSEGLPSISSKYADEGTLAHEIAATTLTQKVWNGIVEFEMQDAVNTYVGFVNECKTEFDDAVTLIEHKFDLSKVHPGLYGTADCVIYYPSQKLLRVIDYKHGAGIPVDVFENKQLLYYGLGAVLSLNAPIKEVELIIVQPRCFHPDGPIRRWKFDSFNLIDFRAYLKERAMATEDPNAPLVPGDHCRFCPASTICPALTKQVNEVAMREFSPTLSYDPKQLSDTLDKLETLEAFIKNVREFAYEEARHGRLPGWKLVAKRPTRKWKDEGNVSKGLAKLGLTSEDIFKEPEIKSPAQIEKLLDKSQKKKLEDLVIAESSGLTLVQESDKRPSVIADPKTVFKQIET